MPSFSITTAKIDSIKQENGFLVESSGDLFAKTPSKAIEAKTIADIEAAMRAFVTELASQPTCYRLFVRPGKGVRKPAGFDRETERGGRLHITANEAVAWEAGKVAA